MKKLYKLCFIIPIPFAIGLVLNLIGWHTKNMSLVKAGGILYSIVGPSVMFVLIAISLVLLMTGRLGDDNNTKRKAISQKKREQADLDEVNSARGRESQIKQGEYIARHAAKNYRNALDKEKILGWLFFSFLMIDFALIMVFGFLNIWVGAIVCFSLFCGTILISFVVVKILETGLMRGKPKKATVLHGNVKACLLSSTTSVGGQHKNSTTRITKVTYRVIITCDGKDYATYSHQFFEEGEAVDFRVIGKSHASIVGTPKEEKSSDGTED